MQKHLIPGRALFCLAALGVVTACDTASAPIEPYSASDITSTEMRKLLSEKGLLTDGLYRVTGSISSAQVPSLPSDDVQARHILEAMRATLASPPAVDIQMCLTAESSFDPRGQTEVLCDIPNVSGEGQNIVFTMVCSMGDDERTATSEVTGTISADGYDFAATGLVPIIPGPTAEMREATVVSVLKGVRVGDCGQ
ncbi:MAG: DUF3617 family protein [Pseudomonadota bacterium]